jgi:hypothetical protein
MNMPNVMTAPDSVLQAPNKQHETVGHVERSLQPAHPVDTDPDKVKLDPEHGPYRSKK